MSLNEQLTDAAAKSAGKHGKSVEGRSHGYKHDLEALARVSAGVLCTSETDAPFEPVFLGMAAEGEELTDEVLCGLLPETRVCPPGISNGDAPVSRDPLDQFFDEPPCNEGDEEKFQAIYDALTDLLDKPYAFYVGAGPEITVYLAGRTKDSYFVGLRTMQVET